MRRTLLIWCFTAAAMAAHAGAEPGRTRCSPETQAVKQELLSLKRDLVILEEDLLFPASSQVAVFLSMDVGEFFQLDAVTVKLDGEEVTHHLYTDRQLDALLRGGVQKLNPATDEAVPVPLTHSSRAAVPANGTTGALPRWSSRSRSNPPSSSSPSATRKASTSQSFPRRSATEQAPGSGTMKAILCDILFTCLLSGPAARSIDELIRHGALCLLPAGLRAGAARRAGGAASGACRR
ncbi:MAG: hypothetical protein U5Q16_13595 [Gammaproteobacteria bacterium]|nr:hypothetical protein [Gammaproteobacteria bacterium]